MKAAADCRSDGSSSPRRADKLHRAQRLDLRRRSAFLTHLDRRLNRQSVQVARSLQIQIQIQIFISSTVQYNTETRGSRPAQHPPRTMTPPRGRTRRGSCMQGGARRLTAPPTRVSPQPRKHLHTHAHVQKRRRLHYHRQRASPGWGSTTRRRGPRGDGNGASQARGRARQAVTRLRRAMTSSKAGRSARSAHPDTFYTD